MTTSRHLSPPRQAPAIKSTASTPNIRKMAVVAPPPMTTMVSSPTTFRLGGNDSLSTLRDPRSESDLRAAAREANLHPDLSLEVAALSNKLISAINHQTHLDDALASAREELRQTNARLREAEARNQEYDRQILAGALMKKEEFEERTSDIFKKYAIEKRARELADREKRAIESELADLSTKLFEEANQLVVKARKETEAAETRTEQVRGQLADVESLLAFHQEQLVELKALMERSAEQEENDLTNHSTAPSTPAVGQAGFDNRGPDTPQTANIDRPDPAPPLSFIHLLNPVLRNDVPAFEDFKGLVEINRKMTSTPASRVNSGSYGVLGLSGGSGIGGSQQSPSSTSHSQAPSGSSNFAGNASQTHSPSQSANSTISAGSSSLYSPTFLQPLRETKFYKRALAEDIDPTLRLDSAPGLSFFARRSVTSAINDNTLVLEPLPAASRKLITSCTLCGERRRGDQHARTHRFKAGDESAQWYPLCIYCVGRIRSTCDYIAFLRMLRDGLWRCDGDKGEERAWEESVRLRERMFWARVGGGVVPTAFTSSREDGLDSRAGSKRPSLDVGKRRSKEFPAEPTGQNQKADPHTPPQTADNLASISSPAFDKRLDSDSSEEIIQIRELPSTAPPLQTSSATTSPTAVVHPRPSDINNPISPSTETTPVAEPIRPSFASSLRRISLRDSLRFGSSKSRNASADRAGSNASPAIGSPRLGAVAEMRTMFEAKEQEIKEERSNSDSNKAESPNGEPAVKTSISPEKLTEDAQPTSGGDAEDIKQENSQSGEELKIGMPGAFS